MNRSTAFRSVVALLFLASPRVVLSAAPPELDRTYLELQGASRAVSNMVACLVSQRPDMARSMFDHERGSPEYAQLVDKFYEHGGNCLWRVRSLKASWLIVEGALAERLIKEDAVSSPVPPMAAPSMRGGGTYSWTWRSLSEEHAENSVPLAQCLLDRHPGRVSEVLSTRQVTRQERAIFNDMSREITDCVPAGEEWVLQPQILRAALASSYYRAARDAAAIKYGAVE